MDISPRYPLLPGVIMKIYKNDPMHHKIYLAGPFFNEEQIHVAGAVEALAERSGVDYFSPRLRCCCPPNANFTQRALSFDMNITAIEQSDLVLARIDDFDAGTMWEMGYAFRCKRPVYAYTMVEGRGLNLMLAQSCKGFLRGLNQIEAFLGSTGLVNWEVPYKIHNGEII